MTLGWDLGGAHLKAALLGADGGIIKVIQLQCPLWQDAKVLDQAIKSVLQQVNGQTVTHAVTMTGELVDRFVDREQGVHEIIGTMRRLVPEHTLWIYSGRLGFLPPEKAVEYSHDVASANWLATAALVADKLPEGLIIDIGSTTTDIVTVSSHQVKALGVTDQERLQNETLFYTGVVRTPVMAVTNLVPFNGRWIRIMAEHFATMADVYRLLDLLPAHADMFPAADSGDKTLLGSARRLARMLGRDAESVELGAWKQAAAFIAHRQKTQLLDICWLNLSQGILDDDAPLIGAGVGRFLVAELANILGRSYIDFNDLLTYNSDLPTFDAADCAPAISVGLLVRNGN